MSTTILNCDIVELRKEKAPQLQAMLQSATTLEQVMQGIMASPLVPKKPQNSTALLNRIATIREQLSNKIQLFSNGVITISVAGIEKSGKTTLLKNITGISALPTDDDRCTAVSCEIVYTENQADEGFVIIYYTCDELLGVIQRQLSYLQQEPNLWREGLSISLPESPNSIEAFKIAPLPPVMALAEEKRLDFDGALAQLHAIKKSLETYENRLGTRTPDSQKKALAELNGYASHSNIVADQPLIRKITIYKQYPGGSPFLRLCDTPGVDDPNPQALEHTLQTIKTETDLLIIANRPLNMPAINKPLSSFLTKLQKLDTSAPLRNRSIFFVNWHKVIDPDKKNANSRIQKVSEKNVFPESSIYGPCDVMDEKHISDFLAHMNTRLLNDIPRQDNELIQSFDREWRSIQAAVRTQVLDSLRQQAPPMPEEMQRTLDFKFMSWFDKSFDSDSADRDVTEYFMGCLLTRMNERTRGCRSHAILAKLRERVKAIRDTRDEAMKTWLTSYANEAKCAGYINANKSPEMEILPRMAEMMTELVASLTSVAEDIGPTVQTEVYSVLEEAMGTEVADKLSPGSTAAERLNAMCTKFDSSINDKDVQFITANLREIAQISMQMRCIMRHELRPALNLMDSFRWHADRREELVKEISDIVHNEACKKWLREKAMLPGMGATPREHSDFFKLIYSASMEVIDTVLSSNSNKFAKLLEDYMSDASQTLATQTRCANGWRKALQTFNHIILADEWARIAGLSANAKEFTIMIEQLEDTLNR